MTQRLIQQRASGLRWCIKNVLPGSTIQISCIHQAFSFKVGSQITVIISVFGEISLLLVLTYECGIVARQVL